MDEDNESASVQKAVCLSGERAFHENPERPMPTAVHTSAYSMFWHKLT